MANQPKEFITKDLQTKEHHIKAIMNMDYQDVLRVPNVPQGTVYGRVDVRRPEKIRQLMNKGWRFVPAERHPELAFNGLTQNDPRNSNYIWFGNDLVLMERSEELHQLERRERDKKDARILLTTPGLENAPFTPNIQTKLYTKLEADDAHNASFG